MKVKPISLKLSILIFGSASLLFLLTERVIIPYLSNKGKNEVVDLIKEYNLAYNVLKNKIAHKTTGSSMNFRGFREQGVFNIQGMEGVDIVWIDESQAITKQTLDILIPTIRKDNAKLFFSMNRYVFNDPVYKFLKGRDDCLHININFDDNPHCTNALKKEAVECRKMSEKDYQHIWMGHPLDQGDDCLYSLVEILYNRDNPHGAKDGYGLRVAGFDVARYGDDTCTVVVLQQMGALHWEEVFVDEWENKDLNYTTGRILQICNEQGVDDAIIDEDGIGSGPLDTLSKGRSLDYFTGFKNTTLSYKEDKEYGNIRTRNAYKTKKMMQNTHLCLKHEKMIEELTTAIRYTFDHQQRRILISKKELRTKGVLSPNLADALIMAVSRIGEVQAKQAEQYKPEQTGYSKEDNLFGIAGIR